MQLIKLFFLKVILKYLDLIYIKLSGKYFTYIKSDEF